MSILEAVQYAKSVLPPIEERSEDGDACAAATFALVFDAISLILNLVGSAAQNGNVLRLTPSAGSMTGSAWFCWPRAVSKTIRPRSGPPTGRMRQRSA